MSADRPLVIGIGNEHAGDDAAGRLVVRALSGQGGFETAESHGIVTDLLGLMEGRAHVVLVDACLSSADPGTIHRFDMTRQPLPPDLRAVSSHGLGLAEAVELARSLKMLPGICQVVAIEGRVFGLGAPLSAPVAQAIGVAAEQIQADLGG